MNYAGSNGLIENILKQDLERLYYDAKTTFSNPLDGMCVECVNYYQLRSLNNTKLLNNE